MNKQIAFQFDGKDYTLEFTRNTVRQMERRGFVADDLSTKPMSVLPDLFAGAFLANHPQIKRDKIDSIYNYMGDKQRLVAALVEMYTATIDTLLDEPDEGKNVVWTPNWGEEI